MNHLLRKSGLLFSLSGENGFCAEWAVGAAEPNYLEGVTLIDDGRDGGKAFRCDGSALRFAYEAPGNIYAARGTLCFSFRPVLPVGDTPFPIFRVGFADHTSWDGVFLRIDYNGSGFDAFVTDTGLARLRVHTQDEQLLSDKWMHIAFSWDECRGVALYVNGRCKARKNAASHLDAALDQFGPYSRLISYWNVQSMFNFVRGGDLDEVLIFDHMLTDEEIAGLVQKGALQQSVKERAVLPYQTYAGWMLRHGWNSIASMPHVLEPGLTQVKKVEIHEAYDGPKWFWKACDGIRETTWPGVFNRSRLKGRSDYFLLPDWDCYSTSGKQIRFVLPNQPWNHVEMTGAAYGWLTGDGFRLRKEQGVERASWRLGHKCTGGELVFANDRQETPISELSVYEVTSNAVLPRAADQMFAFGSGRSADTFCRQTCREIEQRRQPAERRILTAGTSMEADEADYLPCVHLLIPSDQMEGEAIEAVLLELPPCSADGVVGGCVPMNVQIHDPLWTDRVMLDYSFTLPASQTGSLLLQIRRRIRRSGDGLYLTLQTGDESLGSAYFGKIRAGVYYTSAQTAKAEHVADRFIQIKDIYSHMVEERPGSPKLRLFRRFYADIMDLLRIEPDHYLAQCYLYDSLTTCNAEIPNVAKPAFHPTPLRNGVPAWAQRQLEYMSYVKRFLQWWIEQRQIEDGEFGGGLSDDGDLTSWWPGPALCGVMTRGVTESLVKEMDAFLEQGMLTNGLSTIQTDEMHVFEEGITVLGQCLLADYNNPRWLELAMENARAIEQISAINCAGHRHFLSNYFSGVTMAREDPWQTSTGNSYLICHPLYMLARLNREPRLIQLITELADGILAHWKNEKMYIDVRFDDDADACGESDKWCWALAAAYRLTDDERYLAPIRDRVRFGKDGSKADTDETIVQRYEALIEAAALREYINTEAHLWVDRVVLDIEQLQQDRLGGVAHQRFQVYPTHYLTWIFESDEAAESVAILTPHAQPDCLRIRAYNTLAEPVSAQLTLWEIKTGIWRVSNELEQPEMELRHGSCRTITFAPNCETEYVFQLIEPRETGLLPELGIAGADIKEESACIRVTVHSLGGAPSVPCRAVLLDSQGREVSQCAIPALEAPSGLRPVTYDVILFCPWPDDKTGWKIVIDPDHINRETLLGNNSYTFV